eukprot:g40.t1
MVRFVLFPLLGQIVAASFLSFMLFRSDDAAIGLRVATWNIGSVNRNPFEYYFDDIDKVSGIDAELYHLAMEKMQGALLGTLSDPSQRRPPTFGEIITEDMEEKLFELMELEFDRSKVNVVRERFWRARWRNSTIQDFFADKSISMKRLTSLPDRRTAAVTMSPAETVELDSSWPQHGHMIMENVNVREFFKRFQVIQVDADGSCLYHSIVNLLRQGNITKYTSTSLRRLAAKQVRSHPEIYAGFIDESIEEFTASIESSHRWGGEIEIHAISDALQLRIEVFDEDRRLVNGIDQRSFRKVSYGPVESSVRIALLRSNGNHFDALRRRPSKVDRPAMTTCHHNIFNSMTEWLETWVSFMFVEPKAAALIGPLNAGKYPMLTAEEVQLGRPLQLFFLGLFDAALVHTSLSTPGLDVRELGHLRLAICDNIVSQKSAATIDIIAHDLSGCDVVGLQEVNQDLLRRIRSSHGIVQNFHIRVPENAGGNSQISLLLLRKTLFSDKENVTFVVFEDADCRDYLVPGDIHAVMAFTDVTGPLLLASFHGDTGGRSTLPVLIRAKQLSDQTNASFIGMIDANAHADARGGKLSIDLMDTFLQNHDMRSCWPEPTPTTYNTRTLLQPQIYKADTTDRHPKDHIVIFGANAQFNSGKRLPEELMHRIPSGIFPSDHAIVVVDIDFE